MKPFEMYVLYFNETKVSFSNIIVIGLYKKTRFVLVNSILDTTKPCTMRKMGAMPSDTND